MMPINIYINGDDVDVVSESSVQNIKSGGANTTTKKENKRDSEVFVIDSRESIVEFITTDKIPHDKKVGLFKEGLDRTFKTESKVKKKSML